ncbi:prepilin-type N-terminal cleavage/methylation domain-containing protein [Enterococcus sp.]|uniref:prepilin-type N-terminal cleavage/methylation domain-containing protein n=1 Tax=Enterococcus sp. TaxID=35783 RepID=UPI002FCA3949
MFEKIKNKLHDGFTLVEMMVVILIISVLVLLFIPNLGNSKTKAMEESDKAIVATMRTQIELAEFEKGRTLTPEEEAGLFTDEKQKELYEVEIKGKR